MDRARQMGRLVRRWVPTRALVVVGESPDAALEWREAVRKRAGVITRVRLDAALDAPAPPRTPKQNGRPRKKGRWLPTLAHLVASPTTPWKLVPVAPWYGQKARRVHITSATAVWSHSGLPPVPMRWVLIRDPAGTFVPRVLLATTRDLDPMPLLTWFIQPWRLETTVEEARAQLGLKTPRQWHNRRVSRTTPAVFGLYAIVTLAAAHLIGDQPAPVRTTAWYPKQQATLSDAMAWVPRSLWRADHVSLSGAQPEVVQIPWSLCERLTDARCYAA